MIYFYVRSKIIYCNVKEYIAFAHKSYLYAFNLKKKIMKKENNTTDFTKIQAPNFDQLNDIFENNLKIYNNFINNMSEPKKGDQNEKKKRQK